MMELVGWRLPPSGHHLLSFDITRLRRYLFDRGRSEAQYHLWGVGLWVCQYSQHVEATTYEPEGRWEDADKDTVRANNVVS